MPKNEKVRLNYGAEVKLLREKGPERLYFLYGAKEFLRDKFIEELRNICVPDDMGFSHKRLDGTTLTMPQLREAVDSVPFFTERTLVEVRGYDINKCREEELEELKDITADIPETCTLVFATSTGYELDGRMAAVKYLKGAGHAMEFGEQDQDKLIKWIQNCFGTHGKRVAPGDAEYLIFLSGSLMNGLLPEIEKISAYAKGETVTRDDIESAANRIPEANIFRMLDDLAAERYDPAAEKLADLMFNEKDNHPIRILALIGNQLRRMYIVKLGMAENKARRDVMELAGMKYDSHYNNTAASVRRLSLSRLRSMVELCAEYDCRMKSTGTGEKALLREFFARLAVTE